MSSKKGGKGTCELNKHEISLIEEKANFHDQQGVTFSMLLVISEVLILEPSQRLSLS